MSPQAKHWRRHPLFIRRAGTWRPTPHAAWSCRRLTTPIAPRSAGCQAQQATQESTRHGS